MRRYFYCVLLMVGLLCPCARAQSDDATEVPLGDVARALRKNQGQPSQTVIDNDNLSQVMQEVESRRLTGETLLYSMDNSGKGFKVSSPDITCSLSFSSQAAPLLTDQFLAQDLPDIELPKLEGPASLTGDTLQVSLHNGTDWTLREITVGLTIVRPQNSTKTADRGGPKLVNAAQVVQAVEGARVASPTPEAPEKRSDVTLLIHLKGAAAPLSSAVFRQLLGAALSPDQEWHWAIVKARGIPPQHPPQPAAVPSAPSQESVPKNPNPKDPNLKAPNPLPLIPDPGKKD
ncbi:MAG TPA: hypothetical protein VFJ47_05545 [Terriglobales bacterium]|nr:hypothetical protein [Terriglobales bacterium]